MKKNFLFIIIFLTIIISACERYDDREILDGNTPIITPNPIEDNFNIDLYYPDEYNEKLVIKNITIKDITRKIEIEVLEKLISGIADDHINNIIPNDTRVRSIDIENQIAYINFSNDIKKNDFTEKEEVLLIYSIVNTMTGLDSINSVQILIDGEKQEVLSNIFSIENPIKYSDLIVKDEYNDPFDTIEKYYEILNNKDLSKLSTLFRNTDKKSRVYYEMQYVDKNIKEYKIKEYKINHYKNSILVDLTIESITSDDKTNKFNRVFSMIYDKTHEENVFKINEIY
ncbi:MAG: GerMN domain-containing protein [Senegalia sp. (in: firmicutes)]|uniref:GerMN domain-containing protein n=1 Tax=Senegalia sp. (in: firmicutes) TaxID=1924098 RepID=UPI003F9DDAF6